MRIRLGAAACAVLFAGGLAACADTDESVDADAMRTDTATAGAPAEAVAEDSAVVAPDSVTVVFTRDEQAVSVRRPGVPGVPALRSALDALVAGPTTEERANGIESWFSDQTADALRSVALDSSGHAIVDFEDLRVWIPNAASSTGSRLLLEELNGTVFAVTEVASVEYRMDGGCGTFWDWLQYGCQTVTRAMVRGSRS